MASNNVHTILGILLLSAAVVAGHLVPGLDNSEVENGIRNALHILIFAIFAAIIFESLKHLSIPTAIIATIVVIAIVGGISEFLQYSADKQPDLNDFARDLSGAALALCGRSLWRWSHADYVSDPARDTMRAGSVLLGVMIVAPLLYWLTVIALNRSTFPTILSFDNWWETHLYHPINAEIAVPVVIADWPAGAGAAAVVHLSGWGRSGLGILPMVSNWTDYEYLTFIVTMVKGPNTTLTVRINDGDRIHNFSDRFIARITVTNEPTLIRIPLHEMIAEPGLRTMDLSDIQEIVIFARDKRHNTVMLLDEVRLE